MLNSEKNGSNKIFMFKGIHIILAVILSCIVTFGVTVVFCKRADKYEIADLFKKSGVKQSELNKFKDVQNTLKEGYYKEVKDDKLLEGAISGMANSLGDPYTVYYNKEEMDKFKEVMSKSDETYVGIGVTVDMDKNGLLTIINTFENSPAREAGLKPGDKIMKVSDKDVTTIKDEKIIIDMIKGKENTEVKLDIYRPSKGENISKEVKRKKMTVFTDISSEVLEGNIGYIKMNMFTENIYSHFEKELKELSDKNIKGLIIDVRDNGGGSYSEVVKIADRLLPKGLIVYTEDRNKKVEKQESDAREFGLPIVVLVNGNSASASEILAGALKDNKKGKLIGTKTFGKGIVQTVKTFNDGSGLKYTVSSYFTPAGVCIQGKGIEPDIEVKNDKKYENEPVSTISKEEDLQLKKAIEEVKK